MIYLSSDELNCVSRRHVLRHARCGVQSSPQYASPQFGGFFLFLVSDTIIYNSKTKGFAQDEQNPYHHLLALNAT
jgi:hypothetical protein